MDTESNTTGMPSPSEFTGYVTGCARCGCDHLGIKWKQLTQPCGDSTHWASCPKTGEPILMGMKAEPDISMESAADWTDASNNGAAKSNTIRKVRATGYAPGLFDGSAIPIRPRLELRAWRWDGTLDGFTELVKELESHSAYGYGRRLKFEADSLGLRHRIHVRTKHYGEVAMSEGHYLIQLSGEDNYGPCSPEEFAERYEVQNKVQTLPDCTMVITGAMRPEDATRIEALEADRVHLRAAAVRIRRERDKLRRDVVAVSTLKLPAPHPTDEQVVGLVKMLGENYQATKDDVKAARDLLSDLRIGIGTALGLEFHRDDATLIETVRVRVASEKLLSREAVRLSSLIDGSRANASRLSECLAKMRGAIAEVTCFGPFCGEDDDKLIKKLVDVVRTLSERTAALGVRCEAMELHRDNQAGATSNLRHARNRWKANANATDGVLRELRAGILKVLGLEGDSLDLALDATLITGVQDRVDAMDLLAREVVDFEDFHRRLLHAMALQSDAADATVILEAQDRSRPGNNSARIAVAEAVLLTADATNEQILGAVQGYADTACRLQRDVRRIALAAGLGADARHSLLLAEVRKLSVYAEGGHEIAADASAASLMRDVVEAMRLPHGAFREAAHAVCNMVKARAAIAEALDCEDHGTVMLDELEKVVRRRDELESLNESQRVEFGAMWDRLCDVLGIAKGSSYAEEHHVIARVSAHRSAYEDALHRLRQLGTGGLSVSPKRHTAKTIALAQVKLDEELNCESGMINTNVIECLSKIVNSIPRKEEGE